MNLDIQTCLFISDDVTKRITKPANSKPADDMPGAFDLADNKPAPFKFDPAAAAPGLLTVR